MILFDHYKTVPKLSVPEQLLAYQIIAGNALTYRGRYAPDNTQVKFGANYFIMSGKLFQMSGSSGAVQIGTDTGWTELSGKYGICNGKLYLLGYQTTPYQIGTEDGWSKINLYSELAFGIRNGALFAISTNAYVLPLDIKQVGTDTDWSFLGAISYTSSINGSITAIRNGMLFEAQYLQGETGLFQYYGTDTDWQTVIREPGVGASFGIKNGALYYLNTSSYGQVGTNTGWTAISGHMGTFYGYYAVGINNGKLYKIGDYINNVTATQLGTDSGWTAISGTHYNTEYPGYGIMNGKLYRINVQTGVLSRVGTSSDWLDVFGNWSTGFAIRKIA